MTPNGDTIDNLDGRQINSQIITAQRFLVEIMRCYDLVRNKDIAARWESGLYLTESCEFGNIFNLSVTA